MAHIEADRLCHGLPASTTWRARSLKKRLLGVGARLHTDASPTASSSTALRNLDFRITTGERVALVGQQWRGQDDAAAHAGRCLRTGRRGGCWWMASVGALIDVAAGMDPEATGRENVDAARPLSRPVG
jgi:lipopolysaccharide transport system ATP-binding protein